MAERSHSTKLDEQATGKAELSYSYWAANEVKGAAPAPAPKKISEEEAAALHRSASAGSAWNAAGTFEERNLPAAWVQDTMAELMVGAAGEPAGAAAAATVTEVVSASGDCNQWVVRGSIRAGFDLDVKLKWRAEVGGEERTGTVRIPNASWDELDDLAIEVEVDKGEGGGEEAARAAARALLPTVRAKLEELLASIKGYGL